jgi:hypothetical protein
MGAGLASLLGLPSWNDLLAHIADEFDHMGKLHSRHIVDVLPAGI